VVEERKIAHLSLIVCYGRRVQSGRTFETEEACEVHDELQTNRVVSRCFRDLRCGLDLDSRVNGLATKRRF
jgi:hypothetical protein